MDTLIINCENWIDFFAKLFIIGEKLLVLFLNINMRKTVTNF